ncbi:flagellin [Planococcus salinus]|uniref:Flagellin n=1 Tax=Planococcus salinus TaxID=1848460 RepID=A0A3M8P672_9BACL|nr:flagellin [Planococcus salinus]RNF38780.1 flagellin protein FlaA [Planococcus salinus]
MIINHNIAALNTHRQMGSAQSAQMNSMEKLSSGLRINSAKDDAAGLSISEKMRGQIRGLEQASSNAQDGISLMQTAEGALNETHSILQRMRELSVQSSNGTGTEEDRKAIQSEISQLTSEIDRIGNATEFNSKKLLNGSQNQQSTLSAAATGIKGAEVINPMAEGTYKINVSAATEVATDIVAGGTGIDQETELTVVSDGTKVDVGSKFTIKVEGGSTSDYKVTLLDEDGNTFGAVADDDDNSGTITFTSGSESIEIGAGIISGQGTATFTVGEKVSAEILDSNNNSVASVTNEVTTDGKLDVGGIRLSADQSLAVDTNGTDTVEVDGEAIKFQIGANETQTTTLAIRDMRSQALGVSSIDLSSRTGAEEAITAIDSAIKSVSEERSKLGAMQNRLDHTINNLNTSAENLTAAESRIRDVDYTEAA